MVRHKRKRRKKFRTGSYTSTKTGRTHEYRSSYELRTMRCLDADDDIRGWNYESLVIEHKQNNVLTDDQAALSDRKNRSYTPDFIVTHVDGDVFMIEVKSEGNVYVKATQRKKHLGEQYCSMHGMRYRIWTLNDIIPYEMRMDIEMRDHKAWLAAQGDD